MSHARACQALKRNGASASEVKCRTMIKTHPRIALIHATPVAIDPICNTFKRLWPQARVTNLLDDSLSADLAAAGALDQAMIDRFCVLARYVEAGGADASCLRVPRSAPPSRLRAAQSKSRCSNPTK